MEILRNILIFAIPIIVFTITLLIYYYPKPAKKDEYVEHVLDTEGEQGDKWESSKEDYLIRYGAAENLGISKVWQLYLAKTGCACAVALFVAWAFNIPAALAAAVIGFFIPEMFINALNESDNNAMFTDIKALYDTMRIQQSAGVYISSTLTDCYLLVKNKRLKAALREMTADIMTEKDISMAVDTLSQKFRNDYIDEFATVVKQSLQTGQMNKILEDINRQMINIEDVINDRREAAADRKMAIVEILIYIGILGFTLYGLAVSSMNSLYNF